MGLLDRVKQNQTGVPAPAAPATNGPLSAVAAVTALPMDRRPAPVESAAPSLSSRAAAVAVGGEMTPAFTAAKVQIHSKLIEKYADQIDSSNKPGVREKIVELAEEYFRTTAMTMTKADKERLVESVLDDVLGLGPLEALLADPSITEIMANHPKQIYVEKSGEPTLSAVTFESERQMRQVIDRIVSLVGRRVDESTPICDARLKDGSRVNVVIPPIALKGPCLTIRKFAKEKGGPADIVNSCLRMRPDRIIVGECRGGEALDMLQAMNTGHDGSMSTLHANNPHECLVRLETLVLQAGQDLPSRAIRETIGAAIHLIVQQSRLRGGVRRIVSAAEVLGMKDGDVQFQEIFQFKQLGVNAEGKAVGYHTATGVIPMRMEHLRSEGEDVPPSLFKPTPQPSPDKLY